MIITIVKSNSISIDLDSKYAESCPSPYCGHCVDSKCYKCYDSYTDLNFKCIPVKTKIEFCQIYMSSSFCISCKNGYNNINGKCEKVTIPNCLKADSNDICILCEGLSDQNMKCSKEKCSIDNCLSCQKTEGSEICVICQPGYVGNDYSCTKQGLNYEGCLTQNSNICMNCGYGYYDNLDSQYAECKISSFSSENSKDKFSMIKDMSFVLTLIIVLFFW